MVLCGQSHCACAICLVQAPTHQLFGFLQRTLCPANCGFPRLSGRLFDLLYLLAEVGLHQLELGFVTAEALGACICVDEVGHGRWYMLEIT